MGSKYVYDSIYTLKRRKHELGGFVGISLYCMESGRLYDMTFKKRRTYTHILGA